MTDLTVYVCVVHQDLAKVQEQLSMKEDEIKSLKKENRKRRKIIEAYQDMLNAGATGLHTVCAQSLVNNIFASELCFLCHSVLCVAESLSVHSMSNPTCIDGIPITYHHKNRIQHQTCECNRSSLGFLSFMCHLSPHIHTILCPVTVCFPMRMCRHQSLRLE